MGKRVLNLLSNVSVGIRTGPWYTDNRVRVHSNYSDQRVKEFLTQVMT
jgi:hypothetical protein